MLYTKFITEITWEDVVLFCEQRMPENSYLEYKEKFPKHLEKTISAMANTLGGIILIGVKEDDESKPILPLDGVEFQRHLAEKVTGIIIDNIMPPIFPEIAVCKNTDGNKAIVVIRIPQSHQTPHAVASNTNVYLRTGNQNKPEERATLDEIEWLKEHRHKSTTFRDTLYTRAANHFSSLYKKEQGNTGLITVNELVNGCLTLSLCPLFPNKMYRTPPEMVSLLDKIKVTDDNGQSLRFPWYNNIYGTMVQDGIIFHDSRINGIAEKKDYYHTELNCYGLYYYKQTMQERIKNHVGKTYLIMRATDVFKQLYYFICSATIFYDEIGYRGDLDFRLSIDSISNCYLLANLSNLREPYLETIDTEIYHMDVFLARDVNDNKQNILFEAVRKIGWAYNWDITNEMLQSFYDKLTKC